MNAMKADSVISGIFSLILIYIFFVKMSDNQISKVFTIKFKKISLTFLNAFLEHSPESKNKDKRNHKVLKNTLFSSQVIMK